MSLAREETLTRLSSLVMIMKAVSNLVVSIIFWLLQVGMALYGALRTFFRLTDREMGPRFGLSTAKTGGYLINLNLALLMLTQCLALITRASMTSWGRHLGLGLLTPLHRQAGQMCSLGVLIHVVGHTVNLALISPSINWGHPSLVLGFILLGLLLVIVATAYIPCIRRAHFEVFRYCHHLWIPMVILTILHGQFCFLKSRDGRCFGSSVLYWAAAPLLLVVVDSIYTAARSRCFAYIAKVIEHPSKVMELQIKTDGDFYFIPGQYVQLRLPALSRWQWHPFTLTSAPEEDHLSVHIMREGNWTSLLQDVLRRRSLDELPIGVDGPYGCASQSYTHYSCIICIGAGIGQTPFASILRSLWFRLGRPSSGPASTLHFKAIHFVGISRQWQSFEWFNDILAALERSDSTDLLRLHLYITGMLTVQQAALVAACHELGVRDPLTGLLRSHTRFGRPHWDALFASWSAQMAGEHIGVFYCGTPSLVSQLKKLCSRYSHTSTRFIFHQEFF